MRPSSKTSRSTDGPARLRRPCISACAMTRPRRLTGTPKRADSPATWMSQSDATASPPPMQAPRIMATRGTSHFSSAPIPLATISPYVRACAMVERDCLNSEMSDPAANAAASAPVMTMHRTPDCFAPSRSIASVSSSHMCAVKELSRPGLLRRSTASSGLGRSSRTASKVLFSMNSPDRARRATKYGTHVGISPGNYRDSSGLLKI